MKPVNSNQAVGSIIAVGEERKPSDKFTLKEFVLRTDEEYPRELQFTLYDKGIAKFNALIKEGAEMCIKFNITSRVYNESYYFSLVPWSIEVLNSVEEAPPAEEESPVDDIDEEDVPF